ncbi:MAG: M48 family metallopeptidase [Bacillus sp. (in: firmicutes)]
MREELRGNLVHQKESTYFAIIFFFSICTYLLLLFSIIGVGIILVLGMVSYFFHALNMAQIRRNAIKLSEAQFPEIYEKARLLAERMKLKKMPSIYVMESSGILNAFASRFFGKDMVVIYSDIFDLVENDREEEMMFVLAHEFTHVQRRHVLYQLLILPAMWVPFLGNAYLRACEYTCDRHAAYYVGSLEAAQNALTILAIGKELQKRVNKEAYIAQLEEEKGFFAWLSEKLSTHPDLPKRMNNLRNWFDYQRYTLFSERRRNVVYLGLLIAVSYGLITIILAALIMIMERISDEPTSAIASDYDENVGYYEDAADYEEAESSGEDELYKSSMTPLMMAIADFEDGGSIAALIEGESNLDVVDKVGWTALHWAVLTGDLDAIKLLLEEGANPDIQSSIGETPLMSATRLSDYEAVKLLVGFGADKSIANGSDITPLDYAENQKNQTMIELLSE